MDNVIYYYPELLSDLYEILYSARCIADDCRQESSVCANTHDTFGVCFYDGKAEAYELIAIALSALLDKAESGR